MQWTECQGQDEWTGKSLMFFNYQLCGYTGFFTNGLIRWSGIVHHSPIQTDIEVLVLLLLHYNHYLYNTHVQCNFVLGSHTLCLPKVYGVDNINVTRTQQLVVLKRSSSLKIKILAVKVLSFQHIQLKYACCWMCLKKACFY